MPARVLLTPTPTGLQELSLQGEFSHPHWVAFLLSGLAEQKVSVVSGWARQQSPGNWDTRFQLNFQASAAAPGSVDFARLAQTERSLAGAAKPQLGKFQLSRAPDRSLELVVDGPDQLGFLGRLLAHLSILMLFPASMEIDTVAGRIRDRIVLGGFGGSPPTETVRESLETMLNGMVQA